MVQKEQCFIITPIGDENSEIRRHIEGIIDGPITEALGEQYEIVVSHRIREPGIITEQIKKMIFDSRLVIANLTTLNPNVMYELGLRCGIGKPVILIAENGTKLPSDLTLDRTVLYHNTVSGGRTLTNELRKVHAAIDFGDKAEDAPSAEKKDVTFTFFCKGLDKERDYAVAKACISELLQHMNCEMLYNDPYGGTIYQTVSPAGSGSSDLPYIDRKRDQNCGFYIYLTKRACCKISDSKKQLGQLRKELAELPFGGVVSTIILHDAFRILHSLTAPRPKTAWPGRPR